MKVLLDTHVILWATAKPAWLSTKIKTLLSSPELNEILISSISIWEICMLHQKGRIDLPTSTQQWFAEVLAQPKIRVVEISPAIAIEACNLPDTFHSDPADQILIATARTERAILLSKDKRILAYPHVQSAW